MKIFLFLFLVFSLLLVMTGIVGIISPSKFKTTRKNALITLLVGIVFFFIYNGLTGYNIDKKPTNTEKNKQITSESNYLDTLKKEKSAKIAVKDGHIRIILNPNVFSENAELNEQYYKFYASATSYNIDKSVLNAIGQDEVNNLNQYKK